MSNKSEYAFRQQRPKRSSTVEHKSHYRKYKSQLRKDFNQKCGYCDDSDEFCGGKNGFQIDHFAPKSKFPKLTNCYTNLVYSCPYCNRAKSDKWLGNTLAPTHNLTEGFIDCCDEQYDQRFFHNFRGSIVARDSLGQHMIDNLNLFLIRHALIWQIGELGRIRGEIDTLIDQESGSSGIDLLIEFRNLTHKIEKYRKRLNEL